MSIPAFSMDRYRTDIEGWCADQIFFALEVLLSSDAAFGREGPICEIGVHHGKFLIGAHNVLSGQRALGIDIFEDQARNVDGSGLGSLAHFREAIAKYAKQPSAIDPMAADSMDLSPGDLDEIARRFGRFAVFSIDGGHTVAHVQNDLVIAEQLTRQDGIILIDDFFRPALAGGHRGHDAPLCIRQVPLRALPVHDEQAFSHGNFISFTRPRRHPSHDGSTRRSHRVPASHDRGFSSLAGVGYR